MRIVIVSIFFLAMLHLSCRDRGGSSSKVIPGTPAKGQFLSVTELLSCTAFKVAPKSYLTSAFCLFDFEKKEPVEGAKIGDTLTFMVGLNTERIPYKAKITNVRVHAEFAAFLQKTDLTPVDVEELKGVVDLALIDTDSVIEGIKLAVIAKDNWSDKTDTGVVAGFGLAADPFGGTQSLALKEEESKDLYWNRFKITKKDARRFYADSRDLGGGTDIVKIMAEDRGAPVFLDQEPYEKVIGMASGSDLRNLSYFVLFSKSLAACTLDALSASATMTVDKKPYGTFCN